MTKHPIERSATLARTPKRMTDECAETAASMILLFHNHRIL